MKASLKKLQKFVGTKHDRRSRKQHQSPAQDELARATRDMNDMRDCYDRLLSAAAATENSVYEFSESLMEMGDCLLEKTALNDDEESGKVLLMLGKVQFELQKLVDGYRSHIFQTITIPSESLLNELHVVAEMKKRCDERSEIHKDMIKKQKVKGKLRNSEGECFHSHQLQEARDEYDEEANVFVLRMKSLKQGQSRRFLTLASRHHAAQLYFFKKAVRSLEAIEPHVRFLAERLHINYQFSEPKHDGREIYNDNDESDEDDNFEDGYETHDDYELSFDYRRNGPVQDVHILKKLEFDKSDGMCFPNSKLDAAEKISLGQNSFSFQRGVRATSKSAPLFPEKKLDSAGQTAQLRSLPSRKFDSYVLPTPDEMKSPGSRNLSHEIPQTRQAVPNLWHSSPLDQHKYEKLRACEKLSGSIILDTQSVLRESNTTKDGAFPSPLTEGQSFKQFDPNFASYTKKAKRQAFSGPLTGKSWPNKPNFTADGSIVSSAFPSSFSGLPLNAPLPQPSSNPKLSSHVPLTASSPKITELHELPRPPAHLDAGRHSNRSIHSGPLISKSHELSTASVPTTFSAASAFPVMPQALPRSYSIPAGGLTAVALQSPLEGSEKLKMAEDISSPPLIPISESNQHL